MSRRREQSNDSFIIIYDENQEGLTTKNIWINKRDTKVTSVKKEGWSGLDDSKIEKRISHFRKKVLFITGDKEKKKGVEGKDFLPKQNVGIVRFSNNTMSTDIKEQLLKKLQAKYKNPESLIGRETRITQTQILWKTYKNQTTLHVKKLKRR